MKEESIMKKTFYEQKHLVKNIEDLLQKRLLFVKMSFILIENVLKKGLKLKDQAVYLV